ncbi:MAG: DUF2461 domain-containing protein [Bacteroidia bacterium]|nr:DUF2461 domain-containing protein [Bacteroidia bacterium]
MIYPSTLTFLAELKENNHKEWFDANRDRYQESRENLISLVDQVLEGLVEFDHSVEGLEAKKCLFRINRDIRFSKNKSPYKTNMGAFMSKGGKQSYYAGYYVHLEPGSCFVGGGCYQPPAPELKKIRSYIDLSAAELREITSDKKFVDTFGGLQGEELKSAPAGFDKQHPDIDLIRRKDFFVGKNLEDHQVLSEGFAETLLDIFETMYPLNRYLNEAIDH